MPRGLVVLCLAAGALLALPVGSALACAHANARPRAVSERAYAAAIECLVNERRAAAGLRAVGHDGRLARAAHGFSTRMVRERFFAHVSPDGSTPPERARAARYPGSTLGETIGWGAGALATPAAIVQGWLDSPPHRAIMLGAGFRRVGLGAATGSPSGLAGAATVTADFGG